MKTIQITIEDTLLTDVDTTIKKLRSNRSAFIRESLKESLAKMRTQEREEQYRRGYEKYPVKKGEFDVWKDKQCWGD